MILMCLKFSIFNLFFLVLYNFYKWNRGYQALLEHLINPKGTQPTPEEHCTIESILVQVKNSTDAEITILIIFFFHAVKVLYLLHYVSFFFVFFLSLAAACEATAYLFKVCLTDIFLYTLFRII